MKNYQSLDYLTTLPLSTEQQEIVKFKVLNALGITESSVEETQYMTAIKSRPHEYPTGASLFDLLYCIVQYHGKENLAYIMSQSNTQRAIAILEKRTEAVRVMVEKIQEVLQSMPELDKIMLKWYDEVDASEQ